MKYDLSKASKRLSELDLKMTLDNIVIEVFWFRVAPSTGTWRINRHMHSTYEFHFIYSGECMVITDDGEFKARAGEFYLTAPGVYHEQYGIGDGKCIEYSLNCGLNILDKKDCEGVHIVNILSESPCRPVKDTQGVMKLFDKALKEAYYQKVGFYSNIKNLAAMIVFLAARDIAGDRLITYEFPVKRGMNSYRIKQIEKFIDDNLYSSISTSDLAKFMCLSEKQVYRIIERERGMSTKELILDAKVRKAKELLKDTDMSIKSIADRLGFSSEYYFNQLFKKKEGYPPGLFRYNVKSLG